MEILAKVPRKILHFGVLTQLACLVIAHAVFDSHMPADPLKKLYHFCRFPLRKQVDLEIEVTALIGLQAHPVLAYQHEGRKENRFKRQNHGEQREGERIEDGDRMKPSEIDRDPGRYRDQL